nr:SAVED domain-containing protein [uncultured Sulfurimonas sp.]
MKNTISKITENYYFKVITIAVIFLSLFADALNNAQYYYMLGAIVIFFILLAFLDVKKMQKAYQEDTVHIPIVINVDDSHQAKHVFDNLLKDIEKKYKLHNLEKNLKTYSNVIREDLIFTYIGDIDSNGKYDKARLISFLQIIRYQLNKIESNLNNKVEFHLAYYKRPAIGFLIGALFESDGLVIYQNNQNKDKFDEVATIDDRTYKEEVDSFKMFTKSILKEDKNSDVVLLSIKASSHKIAFNADSLSKFTNVISMTANHKGTIGLEEDWVLYAREISTVLTNLQTQYKNITIVHNMPEALAIIVGMAIGNFWNVEITQYHHGDYPAIIKLNEVKCYF